MLHATLKRMALCGFSLAMTAGAGVQAAAPPAAAAGCDPDGSLRYVCGPVNAEDLIRLGDTRWLLASGLDGPLNGGAPAKGHVYLVDTAARTFVDWFPGTAPAFRHDTAMFKDCPGPLDTASFSAHGLDLRQQAAGRFRLYVTGHGAREAIEVFDVNASGAQPTIAWVGCVVLPARVSANSVAILADGGFVTTQFMDRSLPVNQAFSQVTSGQINGMLYEWHPGGKVEPIAGTELSGANGIAISPDGRTIYVAAYGTHEIVRFERGAGALRKQVVKVDITPDNLRWSPDGKLLAAGGIHGAPGAPGAAGWAVLELDPQTLATRRVAGGQKLTGMAGVTAAARVGNEIWVGTYSGTRIGYVPAQ
jgi:DNA-binding beta-propeller fold protein YncE